MRGIAPRSPTSPPIRDDTPGLVTAKADAMTRQTADEPRQQRREDVGSVGPGLEAPPVRRPARDQHDARERDRGGRCQQAGQLAAEAMTADEQRHAGQGLAQGLETARQVVPEELAITPVLSSTGAPVARSMPPPFVHPDGDASRRQRPGQSLVVLRRYAHRRHPEKAGTGDTRRPVKQQIRLGAIGHAQGPGFHRKAGCGQEFAHGFPTPKQKLPREQGPGERKSTRIRASARSAYRPYFGTTLSACGPFWPCVTVYSTF
ncbi:hypothetical protein KCV01_g9275, partial [Aureobasidium melanogenum]